MFKKILLCTDGSDHALKAAEYAAKLAVLDKSRLTLLHICQVPSVRAPFLGAPKLEGPILDRYVRDMHLAVIERTLPVITGIGAHCDILEEIGHPAETIARIANQQEYDLIVLGSRGVSTEKADKLGSVCHSVIQNAYCPVFIVR